MEGLNMDVEKKSNDVEWTKLKKEIVDVLSNCCKSYHTMGIFDKNQINNLKIINHKFNSFSTHFVIDKNDLDFFEKFFTAIQKGDLGYIEECCKGLTDYYGK